MSSLILKEGVKCVIALLILAFLFFIFGYDFLALLFLLLGAFTGYVFRNPKRPVGISSSDVLLSPVDGTINLLRKEDDFLVIEIKSGCMDASVLCAPLSAEITKTTQTNGTSFARVHPLSKSLNENVKLYLDTGYEHIAIAHWPEMSFKTVQIEKSQGAELSAGEQYGVMPKGITSIYLPESFQCEVSIGQKVLAAMSSLGRFS